MIDVASDDLGTVMHILRRHVPDREVVAFGSRATGTAKPHSDLDLAVLGDAPLAAATIAALKDDFDESSLPFKVDVIDWATTKAAFREIIQRDAVLVKPSDTRLAGDRDKGWHVVPLGDLAVIYDGPHATPKKAEAGPIFLGIWNLSNGRLDLSTTEHLTEEDYRRWTRRVEPRADDVVFSYETRLGEAARIPDGLRCCLGRRMGLLRAKPGNVHPRFLLYAYLGPEFQATIRERTIRGSTVDRIPLTSLPDFPIRVSADLGEQRAIAEILGAIDDKIELNRRMNETLEAIARALFKSWFVDFDSSNEEIALSDSGTLEDYAFLNPESWSKTSRPEMIQYVDLANTKWGRIEKTVQHLWAAAPSRAQRVLRTGDTIVGTVRPGNGSYAYVAVDGLTGSTGFAVLRPKSEINREFVYFAATAPDNVGRLAHLADGGAYPAVQPEAVLRTRCAFVAPDVTARFSRIVKPLLGRMAANHQQSETLAAIRDTLLPKLISGELRIKDAERFLAKANV